MNKMKFSERQGITSISQVIQTETMSSELRNSLWNVLHLKVWKKGEQIPPYKSRMGRLGTVLWLEHFKEPLDTMPQIAEHIVDSIRQYFFECKWYEVYDFLEFLLNYLNDTDVNDMINYFLERELAGYRLVGGIFTPIIDKTEVDMLEKALTDEDFPTVTGHLKRALELLSDKENPDYRNSIKESISAVESLACLITGKPKAELGRALKVIQKSKKIHPALTEGFSKLYGYTSDEDGIRHAMLNEPDLSPADAIYMLMSCTSFINYLKAKL